MDKDEDQPIPYIADHEMKCNRCHRSILKGQRYYISSHISKKPSDILCETCEWFKEGNEIVISILIVLGGLIVLLLVLAFS